MAYQIDFLLAESIHLQILAHDSRFITYFKREYVNHDFTPQDGQKPDIKVFVDYTVPEDCQDVSMVERWMPLTAHLRHLTNDTKATWELYFTSNPFLKVVFPLFNMVNLQSPVLEPLIFYRALLKDILLMHASCVSKDGKAVIFPAQPTTGKTTTALRLVREGFEFMGDDMVFVKKDGTVLQYPRRIHLFSYVTKCTPFLTLSFGLKVGLKIKDMIRWFFKVILRKKVYVATRIPIEEVLPEVKKVSRSSVSKIFFLFREPRKDHETITESNFEALYPDLRPTLENNILFEERFLIRYPQLLEEYLSLEKNLTRHLLLQFDSAVLKSFIFKDDLQPLLDLIKSNNTSANTNYIK